MSGTLLSVLGKKKKKKLPLQWIHCKQLWTWPLIWFTIWSSQLFNDAVCFYLTPIVFCFQRVVLSIIFLLVLLHPRHPSDSESRCCCVKGHKRHRIFQVPAVLELEAAMHQLLRQRASRLVQRRQDDIKDESSEFASLSSQSILKVFIIYLNGPVSSLYVWERVCVW